MATVEIERRNSQLDRVARALAGAFDPVLYPQGEPNRPISQSELAELTGLSRQATLPFKNSSDVDS